MAEEKVVSQRREFYEAFVPIVRELDRAHGPLYLAMIVVFDSQSGDDWTFLVGSPSLAADPLRGTTIVAQKIAERWSPDSAESFRRIGVIEEDDPILRTILSTIGKMLKVAVGNFVQLDNVTFRGAEEINIRLGAVFACNPEAIKQRTRRSNVSRKKRGS